MVNGDNRKLQVYRIVVTVLPKISIVYTPNVTHSCEKIPGAATFWGGPRAIFVSMLGNLAVLGS